MISNDLFSAVFGSAPDGETDVPGYLAKQAIEKGFALVLIDPNDHKRPVCTLTSAAAKQRTNEIQRAAQDAGDPNWGRRRHEVGQQDCGVYHAFTDFSKEGTAKVVATVNRLVKRHTRLNFAVSPGASLVDGKYRMLCVDFDTLAEKEAFYRRWSDEVGHEVPVHPTVISPGKVKTNAEGEEKWVHKDGGHHWFMLPEGVELATGVAEKIKGQGGWVAMFGKGVYALVPPSARTEGPYRLVGGVEMIPDWLLAFLQGEVERIGNRREESKAKAAKFYENDPIDGWQAETTWASLLEADEWTATNELDGCDCPTFTRPGGDASHDKSGTAHQPGCVGPYDTSHGHGPLHVWTDNPPQFLADYMTAKGVKTVTKLQYVAARDHAGNQAEAMKALGLQRLGGTGLLDNILGPVADENQAEPTETMTSAERLIRDDPARAEREQMRAAGLEQGSLLDEVPLPDEPEDDGPYGDYPADPVAEGMVSGQGPGTVPTTVYPEELRTIAQAARDEGMPTRLAEAVVYQAEREWAQDQYKRLKNAALAEDIAVAMDLALDCLEDIEEDDEEDLWRIAGLWQQDQTIMLTAKWKAGKTTMVTNVVRCLADGGKFLGQFDVEQLTEGKILIVNAEMTKRQFNRWLFEAGIENRDRVLAFHVREAGPAFGDIIDPTRRDQLVKLILRNNVKILILDPLNPMLSASGVEENSSTDVARWFNALADIKERSGVSEVMLVHHFGHQGERGRGSSKFMDAPDALWTYTMDDEEKTEEDDDGEPMLGNVASAGQPRYLRAIGREVDLPKSVVRFDPVTRQLTIPSMGGMPMSAAAGRKERKERKSEDLVQKVVKLVGDNPGLGWTRLHKEFIGGNLDDAKVARDRALARGLLENRGDPDRMKLFLPAVSETN